MSIFGNVDVIACLCILRRAHVRGGGSGPGARSESVEARVKRLLQGVELGGQEEYARGGGGRGRERKSPPWEWNKGETRAKGKRRGRGKDPYVGGGIGNLPRGFR